MKKQILFSILCFMTLVSNYNRVCAQVNIQNPPEITVTNMPPLISVNDIRTVSDAQYEGDKRRTVPWCEYGDGGFTTDISLSPRNPTSPNKMLVLASTIYDTTKDGLAKFAHFNYITGSRNSTSDNDVALTSSNSLVVITPSITSIVPSDTMVFAVTYKIPDLPEKLPTSYKLVFLYNDAVFGKLTENTSFSVAGEIFYSVRHAINVTVGYTAPTGMLNAIGGDADYNSYVVFDVPTAYVEKNVFITLRPVDSLLLGSTGSVKAVLMKVQGENYTPVGEATLKDMLVDRAHDPNYIHQQDRCITTPKNNTILKYHIHFQNDGTGNAYKVVVKVSLPDKIMRSDLMNLTASVCGRSYPLSAENDVNSDSVIFTFFRSPTDIILRGTRNNPNAFSNPNTMGDIFFTVKTNSNLADTIFSRAAIYFFSSDSRGGLIEEHPVYTSPAISYFTKCCVNCPPPVHCCNFLGLCWWWWVIILIAILLFLWLIIARKKKKTKHGKPDTGAYN